MQPYNHNVLLTILTVVILLVLLPIVVVVRRWNWARKLKYGDRIKIHDPRFEKSKVYLIVEARKSQIFVSSDGNFATARWVPKVAARRIKYKRVKKQK